MILFPQAMRDALDEGHIVFRIMDVEEDKLYGHAPGLQTLGRSVTIFAHPRPRSVSEAEMIEELIQIAETQVTRIHQLRGYL